VSHRVDVLLVEHHLGLESAGIYFVASALAGILGVVSLAISRACRSHVGTPCKEPAAATVLWIVHFSVVLTFVLSPLAWGLAAWLVPWGMGRSYESAGVLLLALLPAALAYAPVSVLSAYFANHAGGPLSRAPGVIAAASVGINALLCWGLVPRFGVVAAAWSAAISHGVGLVCLMCLFKIHAKQSWRGVLWPEALHWRLGAAQTWSSSGAMESQQSRVDS
jgi:O-antigen/teichoic acid export membrane protein